MRLSQLLYRTSREVPTGTELISHQLMIRSGMIRRVAAGIYTWLPMGWRSLHKLANIIREEMNQVNAQEVYLPAIVPKKLWEESGRWDQYGKELLRINDRHNHAFCYGPTHEETVVDLVRSVQPSYKSLPMCLYQIQTKFRDEIRPRFGLMRAREFMMLDGYSFHTSFDDLSAYYDQQRQAYQTIFKRCGLNSWVIDADNGAMGGGKSAEIVVPSQWGESTIITCSRCHYVASLEIAETRCDQSQSESLQGIDSIGKGPQKIATPHIETVDQLSTFLDISPTKVVKTLIYVADSVPVIALCRGDHTMNETKLKKALNAHQLVMANAEVVAQITDAPIGFLGPVGLQQPVAIWADISIKNMGGAVTGANEDDHHYTHVVYGRDYHVTGWADLRNARQGDLCARCQQGCYQLTRGIEVGHIFSLGTTYSKKLNATYLDRHGKVQHYIMGTYGMGLGSYLSGSYRASSRSTGGHMATCYFAI